MKDQDKNSEEDLSEVEIANLLNKGFKVMTVKMIKELRRRMDDQSKKLEVFLKRVRLKNNQTEMRNTITEMKNTLKGNYCRLNDTEE